MGGRGGHGSNLKISIGCKGSEGRIIQHENQKAALDILE